MRIVDNWSAPICFLDKLIFDSAISDSHFKCVTYIEGRYTYGLQGDFIKYIKRV